MALNLRFLLQEPSRKKPSTTITGNNDLRALAPGEFYELFISGTFAEMSLRTQDLVVEYEDVFGMKWRSGLELEPIPESNTFSMKKVFYEKVY